MPRRRRKRVYAGGSYNSLPAFSYEPPPKFELPFWMHWPTCSTCGRPVSTPEHKKLDKGEDLPFKVDPARPVARTG